MRTTTNSIKAANYYSLQSNCSRIYTFLSLHWLQTLKTLITQLLHCLRSRCSRHHSHSICWPQQNYIFFFKLIGKFNAERRIGNSLVSLFAIISRQQTSRLQRILLRHSFEIFKSSVITIFVITISQVNRMITPIFLYYFFFLKKKTFEMDRRQMMNTPPE